MIKMKYIKRICCILIAFLCLFSICCVANADDNSMKTSLDSWISNMGDGKIHRYRYKSNGEEQYRYGISIGNPPSDSGIVKTPQGKYVYQQTEDGKYVASTEISLVGTLVVKDGNNQPVGNPITCTGVVSTESNGMILVFDGVEYKKNSNGDYKVFINGQPPEGMDESTFLSKLELDYDFQVGGTTVAHADKVNHTKKSNDIKTHGQDLWTRLKELLEAIKSIIKDALAFIFSRILLVIADGIRALIDCVDGFQNVTIGQIVYNKCNKLTIDFWNIPDGDESSVAGVLKPVVSFWYSRFRAMAISVYLILLLYAGLRLILSNRANTIEQIKERLNVWLSGVVILFMFPYVMQFTIKINNLVVQKVESEVERVTATVLDQKDSEHIDTMNQIRQLAEDNTSIPLCAVYIMTLGQLILLIILYYKRAFMVAFLITFFPIVCIKHLFDGIHSGGKRKGIRSMDERIHSSSFYTITTCVDLWCFD